jgi:hypothetical protein
VRHRLLIDHPLMTVLWQLGAEPFSAAAIGWGAQPGKLSLSVAGEPRNRDLAFAALLPFAREFNAYFEAPSRQRQWIGEGGSRFECATTAPQVVVANSATAELLGRLGRRLAYLPTTGEYPADPNLVRLGRHLLFLRNHAAVPGQQLIVSLTDLMNAHWVTPQSSVERQSLSALDAWCEPTTGITAFIAAGQAERQTVGPVAGGDEEEHLEPLLEEFNNKRAGRTDLATVRPLLGPIEAFYRQRVEATWKLNWRCWRRERVHPQAPSLARRWLADRRAYTRHMDWLAINGLRRTRQTARQAAIILHQMEQAAERLEAEEACDDPLRMVPALLMHQAVAGLVMHIDTDHRERASVKAVRRPLVTLLFPRPCLMPLGKKLWWSEQPAGREFIVHAITPLPSSEARVTLKLMTGSDSTGLPDLGQRACFSEYRVADPHFFRLPENDPWTHLPSTDLPLPTAIED